MSRILQEVNNVQIYMEPCLDMPDPLYLIEHKSTFPKDIRTLE